ncbi:hypothetical protein A2cp1_3417 [Anaeromyxobacter dehalogenans 2CP-1]|uniref:Uncharacterized protein n=1 Tax=Anaeromyxobacter dehalogenans (strain ATCC BAA-258 / DSM 21875 / 2CP-1) TaxID=455488 RepID=B8JHN5_ANAD2|nr:hypothetical protein [Anaeromyxobacter dehalogenans]ACL66747.1 hypothetical protein A2cp1_3417 [Anaeromyxobacter dehalogenans 2CP-1]
MVKTPKPARQWRVVPTKGFVKGQWTLTPEQDDALREEATRRMIERGARRVDASEVMREILDAWLKRRKKAGSE